MKPIAYKRPDGGVSVIYPAPKKQLNKVLKQLLGKKRVTKVEYEAHVRERSIPEDATEVMDVDTIPEDRYFRNAWDIVDSKMVVDMPKAAEIHMTKIKSARNLKLKELDKRMYGAEKDIERQALRDLPVNIDLSKATTPEELKAIWPTELGDR